MFLNLIIMSEKEALSLVNKLIETRSLKEVEELKIQICDYLSNKSQIIDDFIFFINSVENRKLHMKDGAWFPENDDEIHSITSLIQHVSQENSQ